jgi:hypothetical protein
MMSLWGRVSQPTAVGWRCRASPSAMATVRGTPSLPAAVPRRGPKTQHWPLRWRLVGSANGPCVRPMPSPPRRRGTRDRIPSARCNGLDGTRGRIPAPLRRGGRSRSGLTRISRSGRTRSTCWPRRNRRRRCGAARSGCRLHPMAGCTPGVAGQSRRDDREMSGRTPECHVTGLTQDDVMTSACPTPVKLAIVDRMWTQRTRARRWPGSMIIARVRCEACRAAPNQRRQVRDLLEHPDMSAGLRMGSLPRTLSMLARSPTSGLPTRA